MNSLSTIGEKIRKKLFNFFLKTNFPKEIVEIIASYADFSKYEQKDFEKFEEARVFRSISNTYGLDIKRQIELLKKWKDYNRSQTHIFDEKQKEKGKDDVNYYSYLSTCLDLLNNSQFFDGFFEK